MPTLLAFRLSPTRCSTALLQRAALEDNGEHSLGAGNIVILLQGQRLAQPIPSTSTPVVVPSVLLITEKGPFEDHRQNRPLQMCLA